MCASFLYNKYNPLAIHAGEMATQNVNTYQSNRNNHKIQENDLTKTEMEHLFAHAQIHTQKIGSPHTHQHHHHHETHWNQLPDIKKCVLNRSKRREYLHKRRILIAMVFRLNDDASKNKCKENKKQNQTENERNVGRKNICTVMILFGIDWQMN